MARLCLACKARHDPLLICQRARLLADGGSQPAVVVHKPIVVVHSEPVVVHTSKHGKHRDTDERRAYRREWMRRKRSTTPTNQEAHHGQD